VRFCLFGFVAAVLGMAIVDLHYPVWLEALTGAWIGIHAAALEWREERIREGRA
jgi:hypothetical protein